MEFDYSNIDGALTPEQALQALSLGEGALFAVSVEWLFALPVLAWLAGRPAPVARAAAA